MNVEISSLKNRKAAGGGEIKNELLKYRKSDLISELTYFDTYQILFTHGKIPIEWKTSITILLFKKSKNCIKL